MKLKFTAMSVVSVVVAATAIVGPSAGAASAGYLSCLDMNLNPIPCPIIVKRAAIAESSAISLQVCTDQLGREARPC